MSKSGRLTHDDPDAGTSFPPRRELFYPAVVQLGRRAAPVLREDLSKIATPFQGGAEHALHHRFLDHRYSLPPPAQTSWRAALDGRQPTAYGFLSCL
jgi:hypothetical protein